MKQRTRIAKREDLSHILRERGCKVTPARLAILNVLEKSGKPLSVEKIIHALVTKKLDKVTIYRTLATLKECHLIRQIDFQHGHAHYELSSLGDHHHAVCVKCQTVEDVTPCNLEAMTKTALKQSGFAEITEHALEFFGVCRDCQRVSP